ncbi:hypothetical protein WICMUC_003031 [Wickerhamomyces mucosus]|uniref:RNA polymerase II assembly factor Rtp1 C-terminal domain-containing protein n=1 Tax=Wickerhamomyces mucosus TaxID=1378264 RepID=A0A9P8PMG5_9ASCO|nr:hypothetical protein WICMUC_003031 [Wickerhamomyces mucosus]
MANTRKGLNVPQINRLTDLDILFNDLAEFLKIDEDIKDDALTQLYVKLDRSNSNVDVVTKIDSLTDECFKYIHKIQELSLKKQLEIEQSDDAEKLGLISISLHDMKYFNELINFIVAQLIYPCLPREIGISLDQRRLNSFTENKKIFKFNKINPTNSIPILEKIISNFEIIFSKKSDLRDLLLKGTGLTDIITILIVLTQLDNSNLKTLIKFEDYSDAYNLFGIYIALIQSSSQPIIKKFISERLSSILIERNNGVMSLIDFIIGIRDDEEINVERFDQVNQILMAKPKSISSIQYYTKLFDQVYNILIFINRPIMLSVVVNFVRVIYERNKKIVHDFLFKRIWKILDPDATLQNDGGTIISSKNLNDVINVLISLTKENSADFLIELFQPPIVLNLWAYYFYLNKKALDYKSIIQNILVTFFTLTTNNEVLEIIVLNLIRSKGESWKFETNLETKLTSIVNSTEIEDNQISNEDIFDDIDLGMKLICELLKNLDHALIRTQFSTVLNRWILKSNPKNDDNGNSANSQLGDLNPFLMLIDLKFLERINEQFKDVLLEKPQDVLMVIKNLLSTKLLDRKEEQNKQEEVDSDDEEDETVDSEHDNLNILLELLSAIISETNPSELDKQSKTLKEISEFLLDFKNNKYCISLHNRIEDFLSSEKTIIDQNLEYNADKQLLEKAINNMNDPLIPIRAHGLYLLRQLIIKKSEVISLDFVIELHLVQLKDSEPFIYLNVIKSLIELIEFDKDSTLVILIKLYSNQTEQLDDRLKVGEVLLNFMIKSGELLTGSIADLLITTFLNTIRDFEEDNKIRMSAMSLLGQSLRTNALGIQVYIKDSLDIAIGVFEFEKDEPMLRSAVVLVSDLISFGGLEIVPKGYGTKLKTMLGFVKVNNYKDYLLVEQIDKVLETIEELIINRFKIDEAPGNFQSLKIIK